MLSVFPYRSPRQPVSALVLGALPADSGSGLPSVWSLLWTEHSMTGCLPQLPPSPSIMWISGLQQVNCGAHPVVYGRSSSSSHARLWGLARWGHDPFPGGRAARHLGSSMSCAFCSSATGDLFHCLAECVAFNDLRMELVPSMFRSKRDCTLSVFDTTHGSSTLSLPITLQLSFALMKLLLSRLVNDLPLSLSRSPLCSLHEVNLCVVDVAASS